MHRALGLSTLKEQQLHFDRVIDGKETDNTSVGEHIMRAMEQGSCNEINGVGTLVGKVLPVYMPTAVFFEEGFYSIKHGIESEFIIVSPDGSCRQNSVPVTAIEIKCPLPGKKVVPDVHYRLPDYYVCQVLSEMTVLNCTSLFYVCWTPQSTTVFKVQYDFEVWQLIHRELTEIYIYGSHGKKPVRPKRKSQMITTIKQYIKEFKENKVEFLAEFPSLLSSPCKHDNNVMSFSELRGQHRCPMENSPNTYNITELAYRRKCDQSRISETQQLMMTLKSTVQEAYNVLRMPAKEVIVALISDMDRIKQAEQVHAIPIAYGLSGYSLPVASIRSIFTELLRICHSKGIYVCALSTDGQFYQMCVRDADDKPLTVLQLAKDTWNEVKKVSKSDQIKKLMSVNYLDTDSTSVVLQNLDFKVRYGFGGGVCSGLDIFGWKNAVWETLLTPVDFQDLMYQTTYSTGMASGEYDVCGVQENTLDQSTPDGNDTSQHDRWGGSADVEDILSHDTEEGIVGDDSNATYTHRQGHHSSANRIPKELLTSILSELRTCDASRKKAKWVGVDEEQIQELLFSDGKIISQKLVRKELLICHSYLNQHTTKPPTKMTKVELVNSITNMFGNDPLPGRLKTPKSLRMIIKDMFNRKYSKEAINAITATNIVIKDKLPEWRSNNCAFQTPAIIGSQPEPYVWYCQPEYFEANGRYVEFLLDCHHLFVNARCHVCQNGITGLGVSKEAWIEVAEDNKRTNVGLNIAMVKDLIDRQSNAIAQVVFSEKVEDEMKRKGWFREAEFCKRIREWYKAEDGAGISAIDRHTARMEMRKLLLSAVNLAKFPPPGSSVGGMTIVMFEGILTNIDRRTQLYALVPGETYNVRAPTSLDAENLFSEF